MAITLHKNICTDQEFVSRNDFAKIYSSERTPHVMHRPLAYSTAPVKPAEVSNTSALKELALTIILPGSVFRVGRLASKVLTPAQNTAINDSLRSLAGSLLAYYGSNLLSTFTRDPEMIPVVHGDKGHLINSFIYFSTLSFSGAAVKSISKISAKLATTTKKAAE